ncbi:hypothetical protein IG631_05450 [Alternaria alternata]|nr:hypothetical protein IG631_05450 [Alternaria alternata]
MCGFPPWTSAILHPGSRSFGVGVPILTRIRDGACVSHNVALLRLESSPLGSRYARASHKKGDCITHRRWGVSVSHRTCCVDETGSASLICSCVEKDLSICAVCLAV